MVLQGAKRALSSNLCSLKRMCSFELLCQYVLLNSEVILGRQGEGRLGGPGIKWHGRQTADAALPPHTRHRAVASFAPQHVLLTVIPLPQNKVT